MKILGKSTFYSHWNGKKVKDCEEKGMKNETL